MSRILGKSIFVEQPPVPGKDEELDSPPKSSE
jgi:hypothetical protein